MAGPSAATAGPHLEDLDLYGLKIIEDGGAELASRHLWSNVTSFRPLPPGYRVLTAADIRKQLDEASQYVDGEPKFIPLKEITRIINPSAIFGLLRQLRACERMQDEELEQLTKQICFVQYPAGGHCCRRLVAMLIKKKREEYIPYAVQTKRLTDHCLSEFIKPPSTLRDSFSGTSAELYKIFNTTTPNKEAKVRALARAHSAVFFTRPGTKDVVYHYILSPHTILPFTAESPASKNDDEDGSDGNEGGFGVVSCTTFHSSHFVFSNHGTSTKTDKFAVKKLNRSSLDEFAREISALLRFAHENKKQLVKLLATFEMKGEYYLIFPWADRSVLSLWKKLSNPRGTEYTLRWMLAQSLAIAQALKYIHVDYAKFEERRAQDMGIKEPQAWGRHGDIKAGNFLLYRDERGVPLIFMADFGLARFHRIKTRSIAAANSASQSYRPPEFDTGSGLSRKSDIWCLGIFFLEFLTWYLKGWKAVDIEFRDKREEKDHQGVLSDIFFRLTKEDRMNTITVKSKVTDWIDDLHEHPATTKFVHDALDLIQHHMLVAEPSNRISAAGLERELQVMNDRAQRSQTYCDAKCPYSGGGVPIN